MAAMVRTSAPGVYKRGARYVFSYRDERGRQRWESCRTLDQARRAKAARQTDISRGEFEQRSKITLHEYATDWIDRYHGTGRRGFREETRAEYRSSLTRYALEFYPSSTQLVDVDPKSIATFIGWLVKRPNGRGGTLTDKTIRNALTPLMACLATAKREGLIRANPAAGAALPHRPQIIDDEEKARPFPGDTMVLVVSLIHPDHRPMFELLAATGVRRSELLAFRVQDLELDGARPRVKVRQRTRAQKGKGQVVGALKSRHARRDLPIPLRVADSLRPLLTGKRPDELVFESPLGGSYDPAHIFTRVLRPACAEAGVEWAGFHTFRHTVASQKFAAGSNAKQVQHWLGHHSAAFTQDTYVHLLDGDIGEAFDPWGVNNVRTDPTPFHTTTDSGLDTELAGLQAVSGLDYTNRHQSPAFESR